MFVDTNVVVAVRFVTAPHHRIAVSNLDRIGNSPETLRISRQVHDANIVATMLAHGERRLLTFSTRDFRRYGDRIDLIDVEMAGGHIGKA